MRSRPTRTSRRSRAPGWKPRSARPNEPTRFTYTLATRAQPADSGFDRLRFVLPEPADLEAGIQLHAGDALIDPATIEARGDTLFITLPQPITADSLAIRFTTRVLRNATRIDLDLGASERPGLWQSVEAMTRRANIVLLPAVPGSRRLIGDLAVVPPVFSPNGDGVNDQLTIRFVVLKVDAPDPQVQVFDLTGRLVRTLYRGEDLSGRYDSSVRSGLVWDGRDQTGGVVPPGIYLVYIEIEGDSKANRRAVPVAVAY